MLSMQSTEAIRRIESAIGYTFRDKRLLVQVFTRKTFMKIDPEAPDNEVLEFYGDTLMSYHVTTYFVEKFAHMLDDGLYFMRTVEQFTEMRSHYVRNQYLTDRIKQLIPNIDRLVRAQNPRIELPKDNQKAYADLFESLIGAVYLDSYRDDKLIRAFILRHLNLDPKESADSGTRTRNVTVLPAVSLLDDLSTETSGRKSTPASSRNQAGERDDEAVAEEAFPSEGDMADIPMNTEDAPERPNDPDDAAEMPRESFGKPLDETATESLNAISETFAEPIESMSPTRAEPIREALPPAESRPAVEPSREAVKRKASSARQAEAPISHPVVSKRIPAPMTASSSDLVNEPTLVPTDDRSSDDRSSDDLSADNRSADGGSAEGTAPLTERTRTPSKQDELEAFCREVGYELPVYGETPKNAPNARPVAACTVRFRNARGKPVKISLNDSGKTLAEATERAAAKMLKKLTEQRAAESKPVEAVAPMVQVADAPAEDQKRDTTPIDRTTTDPKTDPPDTPAATNTASAEEVTAEIIEDTAVIEESTVPAEIAPPESAPVTIISADAVAEGNAAVEAMSAVDVPVENAADHSAEPAGASAAANLTHTERASEEAMSAVDVSVEHVAGETASTDAMASETMALATASADDARVETPDVEAVSVDRAAVESAVVESLPTDDAHVGSAPVDTLKTVEAAETTEVAEAATVKKPARRRNTAKETDTAPTTRKRIPRAASAESKETIVSATEAAASNNDTPDTSAKKPRGRQKKAPAAESPAVTHENSSQSTAVTEGEAAPAKKPRKRGPAKPKTEPAAE